MLCRGCGVSLPEESQFCFKCGRPMVQRVSGQSSAAGPEAHTFCKKCGAKLPEGSRFCLMCGQDVNDTYAPLAAAPAISIPPIRCRECKAMMPAGSEFCPVCGKGVRSVQSTTRPRKLQPVKHYFVLWFFLLSLAGFLVWAVATDNPITAPLERLVNRSHTETITPLTFTVRPRGFSYYKVMVPAGASRISVSGQFSVDAGGEKDIEVYLLSDGAFVDWQNGYSGMTYYSSGKVGQDTIAASLPVGSATYYLVFSNKFASKASKSVQATVTLNYSRWWPII